MTTLGAARLFIFARGRDGANIPEDIEALDKLLQEAQLAAIESTVAVACQVREKCAMYGSSADTSELFARTLRQRVAECFNESKRS